MKNSFCVSVARFGILDGRESFIVVIYFSHKNLAANEHYFHEINTLNTRI